MIEEIIRYWNVVLFLVPLGIVGIWRWSVWMIKKIISLFYRVPKGNFYSTLSIVTPVYNEDPDMFRLALESWRQNEPDEIVAVIDHSNPELIQIFKHFADRFDGAKLFVTEKPGKRGALADGIKLTSGEIVALVDSDTIWSPDIKRKLLAPFSDPEVGGLTTRQDVLKADTLARRLFKILLDDRYLLEYPFLTTASNALLCLSGRTAVYRRIAIADKLERLEHETFWGKPMISGDDKTLTNLVHAAGWKTRFLRNVKVYTPGTPDLGTFLKQKLRWARNGIRSDSKVLLSAWAWKNHKVLAIYMIDKSIAAITILLAPIYFFVALFTAHWNIAGIILIWWMVSRSLKMFPHLREKPSDIFMLPVYVVMTFVMAIIKIYAFFTLDKQGWITRWDTKRLKGWNPFRQALSYVMTFFFVGGYFMAVGAYQYETLTRPPLIKENIKEKVYVSIISDQPRLISNVELVGKKQSILNFKENNASGYYVVKAGDTLLGLRQKFNLNSVSSIRNDKNVPYTNLGIVPVGTKVQIPASELRNIPNADALLDGPNRFIPSPVTYDRISNTINVKGGESIVTLTKIKQALGPNSTALQQIRPGEWILRSNLYIGKNVTLVLDKRDVTLLKLKSDKSGFVWVRSQNGNILVSNTKITSWDESLNAPDTNVDDGRSYLTAKSSGRMDIVNSDVGYLGFVGYRSTDIIKKRGGLFGGSYGLSWKITSGKLNDNLLTGSVIDSKIHDNYFGIYTFGATGLLIKNNDVHDNIQYGIDPHDDSNNLVITENRAYNNGNHGIILSKRNINNEISNNISYGNKLHGIMLDRSSNNNIVTGNTVYGNVDGIVVYESNYNLISNNTIHDNKQGVRLNTNASYNFIEKNKISANTNGVHVYGGATGNVALDNSVINNNIALSIQDATNNVFYGNFKPLDNVKDGNIAVGLDQNEIKL